MGKLSKAIMEKAGILPKLRLGTKTEAGTQSTGPHQVKLISEKQTKGKDYHTQNEVDTVTYIFEEQGEVKEYEVPMKNKEGTKPHYFVLSMAAINEGEEIILEMKKKGIKNYISLQRISTPDEHEMDDEPEDHNPDEDKG